MLRRKNDIERKETVRPAGNSDKRRWHRAIVMAERRDGAQQAGHLRVTQSTTAADEFPVQRNLRHDNRAKPLSYQPFRPVP
jgi:hypothetical protein